MEREVRPAKPLTMYELIFPSDLNSHGTMFGGKVIALMDKCAGMCVGVWTHRIPVTASIDAIQFINPIHQGQMVEINARIVFVGRTSCIAKVQVTAHDLPSGDEHFCCEGYFGMVGLDSNNRPVELPLIPIESEQDQYEWERAEKIKQVMLERRKSACPPGTV
jgi:acyl-CoA hydrolase